MARLAEYISIDTTNPPGNESRGVAFLARILDGAGIPYETAESAPGRGNLWARLPGGDEPALVLLHHIDVVPADARHWTVPPLAGEIRDGYLYGRGALDMKSLGIAQLEAFLALAAAPGPRTRDVVLVATADEEAGGAMGAGWLVQHHWPIFEGAGFLLNEGGAGRRYGDATIFGVEVTQKVPLWLRVTARGEPGHGSRPRPESAVTRLLRAGAQVGETRFPPRAVPAVAAWFAAIAPHQPASLIASYQNVSAAIADPRFLADLEEREPSQHALLRNTCAITRLEGSAKINVIPPEASMELDCRLLPDQDPDRFIEELRRALDDPELAIETLLRFTPAVSTTETPLFELIAAVTRTRVPEATVVPGVSTGFTDSHFFRDRGIVSYGFAPFVLTEADLGRAHGNDERIAIAELERGTAMLTEIVQRFARGGTRHE